MKHTTHTNNGNHYGQHKHENLGTLPLNGEMILFAFAAVYVVAKHRLIKKQITL